MLNSSDSFNGQVAAGSHSTACALRTFCFNLVDGQHGMVWYGITATCLCIQTPLAGVPWTDVLRFITRWATKGWPTRVLSKWLIVLRTNFNKLLPGTIFDRSKRIYTVPMADTLYCLYTTIAQYILLWVCEPLWPWPTSSWSKNKSTIFQLYAHL